MFPLWLNIIILLVAIHLTLVVLMEHRRPTTALAWILVLVLLPVVGIVLYYFFGVSLRNKHLIDRSKLMELKMHTEPYQKKGVHQRSQLIPMLLNVNRAYPTGGNDLKVYTLFQDMLDDLKADMERARHHIHFLFFKIESDAVGREISEVLIRKAQEGVEVRVMYDAAACWLVPRSFYRKLKKGGVQVQAFSPIFPVLSPFANYRNHRKIVVVDGKVGYTGGMNMAERYRVGISTGIWRDTHVRITGPAVTELQTAFLCDWYLVSKQWLSSEVYYPAQRCNGNKLMQVVISNPSSQWRVMDLSLSEMISAAQEYVYLQTPYFIPSDAIRKSLYGAAWAGVDVRLMIPARPDVGMLVSNASKWYLQQMMEAGVRVFLYDKGFLHAKTVVADDRVVSIGSVNIDNRSVTQSFEINTFTYDEAFAQQQREVFLHDMESCHELDLNTWLERPVFQRFKESVARLFAPLL